MECGREVPDTVTGEWVNRGTVPLCRPSARTAGQRERDSFSGTLHVLRARGFCSGLLSRAPGQLLHSTDVRGLGGCGGRAETHPPVSGLCSLPGSVPAAGGPLFNAGFLEGKTS